jgi:hypothetical protein
MPHGATHRPRRRGFASRAGKCVVKWIGYADDDEVDIATLRP